MSRRLIGMIPLFALLAAVPAQGQVVDRSAVRGAAAVQEALASERNGEGPVKCGLTPLTAGLARVSGAGLPTLAPPSLTAAFDSPGGSFRLHYDTAGTNAVPPADTDVSGVPDFIEAAAASLDSVAAGYVALGWRQPPTDMIEDARYDIYFLDTEVEYGSPIFGITWATAPTATSAPFTSASYIELDCRYDPVTFGLPTLDALRVTIAHEYHHAIQFAYSLPDVVPEFFDFTWFAELSATSFEEVFYSGINDYYNYLYWFLNYPELALDHSGFESPGISAHKYGAVLWALYLEQVYGADALLEIWTDVGDGVTPIEAHRTWLADRGSTLEEDFGDFTVWLLYTGTRDDGAHFPEGGAYPSVKILPVTTEPTLITLPRLASKWYQKIPSPATGGAVFQLVPEVSGSSSYEWGLTVAGVAGTSTVATVRSSTLGLGPPASGTSVELFDWGTFNQVIRWAWTGDNTSSLTGGSVDRSAHLDSRHSSSLVSAAVPAPLGLRQNYPNPFRPATGEMTYFVFETAGAGPVEIEVRTLTGRSLYRHTFTVSGAGMHFTGDTGEGWDGTDTSGAPVPSGVYLLIARTGDQVRTRKLSVVR